MPCCTRRPLGGETGGVGGGDAEMPGTRKGFGDALLWGYGIVQGVWQEVLPHKFKSKSTVSPPGGWSKRFDAAGGVACTYIRQQAFYRTLNNLAEY